MSGRDRLRSNAENAENLKRDRFEIYIAATHGINGIAEICVRADILHYNGVRLYTMRRVIRAAA